MSRVKKAFIVTLVGLPLGGLGIAVLIPGLTGSQKSPNDIATMRWLWTIVLAQRDFRTHHRGGEQCKGCWRNDIAGLYALPGPDGQPIRIIMAELAAADDRPKTEIERYATRGPRAGYWYRALRFSDETEPDPSRFAVCAFPSEYSPEWPIFLLNYQGVLYKKQLQSGSIVPPDVYPDDPEADGWKRAEWK